MEVVAAVESDTGRAFQTLHEADVAVVVLALLLELVFFLALLKEAGRTLLLSLDTTASVTALQHLRAGQRLPIQAILLLAHILNGRRQLVIRV